MNTFASFLAAAALAVFGGATTTPAIASLPSCATLSKTLQVGSRGEEVKKLQQFLGGETTGYFGPLTRQKLIDWQISKKIVVSAKTQGAGTTGPKTRAALKCGVSTVAPASTSAVNVAPVVAASTSITATTSVKIEQSMPTAAPSGGGVSVPSMSPYGYSCAVFGEKPQTACDGSWQLSLDEASCIIWACMSNDERG